MKTAIGILGVLMVIGFAHASLSISGVSLTKSVYNPGDSGAIALTVANAGDAFVLEAVSLEVSGSQSFTYDSTVDIGDMNPGTSTTLSIPFKVQDNAQSGLYVFQLKFQGRTTVTSQTGQLSNLNYKSATVTVPVLRKPVLSVSNYSGIFNENQPFSFNIDDNGGSVEGLRVSVAPPFAIYGTNEVFIGGLNASTNVLMNLNVVGVSEGGNTLTMIMNYRDELGNDVTENKSVTLTVKKEQTDLVFSQSSDIFSKKNGLARFEVTNNGKDLKDVRLTLDQAGLIVQGGGEIRVGDIASGETKFFEFTLYPDVTPGTQSVAATVTYMEDGVEKTKGISITLDVGSDSDVQVFVDAKPLPITRGQDETLSVTVANTWDYPIQSVSVSIDGDFFDLVSVQNEQYIGLLNNDDFSSESPGLKEILRSERR